MGSAASPLAASPRDQSLATKPTTNPTRQLPRALPRQVTHGSQGPGHTGARKFGACLPALRWQNPEAAIESRWVEPPSEVSEPQDNATVRIAWHNRDETELEVLGARAEQIMQSVLQAAGSDEEDVRRGVEWAARMTSRPKAAEKAEAGEGSPSHDVEGGA